MKKSELPDFTDNFMRIFKLANCVRKLREAFAFSENDERARRDKAFIMKCDEHETLKENGVSPKK
ncbi:MAG: hypothetical protein GXP32_04110 [Kiritimatiellaeota bacterium]|nr:hypothetical protein [Kiritimatiellota bacterium]